MKRRVIILVTILLINTIVFCQSNFNEFDDVYKKEIQEENRALSQRIQSLPTEVISINNEIKIAIRNNDFLRAFNLGVEMDEKLPNNDDIKNFFGENVSKTW